MLTVNGDNEYECERTFVISICGQIKNKRPPFHFTAVQLFWPLSQDNIFVFCEYIRTHIVFDFQNVFNTNLLVSHVSPFYFHCVRVCVNTRTNMYYMYYIYYVGR